LGFKSQKNWLTIQPTFLAPLLMPAFILFPSLGVWAMRTRLRYYVQPLYQPALTQGFESDQLHKGLKERASSLLKTRKDCEKSCKVKSTEAAPKR